MCEKCKDIILRKQFYSPRDYLNCIEYIKELLKSGNFKLVYASCNIDKVIDKSGKWNSDIIEHIIRCKKCKTRFVCQADTYHGNGGFEAER